MTAAGKVNKPYTSWPLNYKLEQLPQKQLYIIGYKSTQKFLAFFALRSQEVNVYLVL